MFLSQVYEFSIQQTENLVLLALRHVFTFDHTCRASGMFVNNKIMSYCNVTSWAEAHNKTVSLNYFISNVHF